jgi:hypothetical protein
MTDEEKRLEKELFEQAEREEARKRYQKLAADAEAALETWLRLRAEAKAAYDALSDFMKKRVGRRGVV